MLNIYFAGKFHHFMLSFLLRSPAQFHPYRSTSTRTDTRRNLIFIRLHFIPNVSGLPRSVSSPPPFFFSSFLLLFFCRQLFASGWGCAQGWFTWLNYGLCSRIYFIPLGFLCFPFCLKLLLVVNVIYLRANIFVPSFFCALAFWQFGYEKCYRKCCFWYLNGIVFENCWNVLTMYFEGWQSGIKCFIIYSSSGCNQLHFNNFYGILTFSPDKNLMNFQ